MRRHRRTTKSSLVAWLMLIYGVWTGCALPLSGDEYPYGDLGHFAVHSADRGHDGVVVGVPYGSAEPAAVELAHAVRDALGAGLVVAYDFKNKRIPVDQPLINASQVSRRPAKLLQAGSVYPAFRKLVQAEAGARIKFYIGVRAFEEGNPSERLEVATVGLSFEQLEAIKNSFVRIRDTVFFGSTVPKLKIAVNTLDTMSWRPDGVKNHGMLLLADKGLVLSLPKRRAWIRAHFKTSSRSGSSKPSISCAITRRICSRSISKGIFMAAWMLWRAKRIYAAKRLRRRMAVSIGTLPNLSRK